MALHLKNCSWYVETVKLSCFYHKMQITIARQYTKRNVNFINWNENELYMKMTEL